MVEHVAYAFVDDFIVSGAEQLLLLPPSSEEAQSLYILTDFGAVYFNTLEVQVLCSVLRTVL